MELLPAATVATVLAAVILYLLNANRADRVEHRRDRGEWDTRFREMRAEYEKEISALQTRHDTEVRELRTRIDTLEAAKNSETRRADRAEATLEARGA